MEPTNYNAFFRRENRTEFIMTSDGLKAEGLKSDELKMNGPKTEGLEAEGQLKKPKATLTRWQKYITTVILFYVMFAYVSYLRPYNTFMRLILSKF